MNEYARFIVHVQDGVTSFEWQGKARKIAISEDFLKNYRDGNDYRVGPYNLAFLSREGFADQYVVFVRKDSLLWFVDVVRYRSGRWFRRMIAKYIVRPLSKWTAS